MGCTRTLTADVTGRQHLRSASQRTFVVGRLKMQDWKMSDESAGLEFDGLAMRVIITSTDEERLKNANTHEK